MNNIDPSWLMLAMSIMTLIMSIIVLAVKLAA